MTCETHIYTLLLAFSSHYLLQVLNLVYFVPQEHQHSLTSTQAGSSWNQRQLVKRNYTLQGIPRMLLPVKELVMQLTLK